MEEYIGKICPFCKTEIKEGDAVTVCPECGIPHHTGCWAENGGCTTFGCAGKAAPAPVQAAPAAATCANCGAPLEDEGDFCTQCGAPKAAPKKPVCGTCGAELEEGQAFCQNCGQRADIPSPVAVPPVEVPGSAPSAISQFNAQIDQNAAKKKKSSGVVVGVIVGVVAIAVIALIAVLLLSPKDPTGITLSQSSMTIERGETATLTYTLSPGNVRDTEVTWRSDNRSVATVSNGKITAVGNGTCDIIATTDNGITGTCRVTVTMPQVEQRMVGTWNGVSIYDLDDKDTTYISTWGWTLRLNSDGTGSFKYGSGNTMDFTWHYQYTNSYGNNVYYTDDDEIYFIYAEDYREVWLYLQGSSINWCISFD